jgi:hypothetical protein
MERKVAFYFSKSLCKRLWLTLVLHRLSFEKSLDSYITTIDSNIELFNQYVNINRAGLQARGETTDDLIINLFKAYLSVADQNFVEYMKKKKDDYDEGTTVLEPETLMTHALNKYHISLVQEKKWKSMSPQDEQLVALKAQYEQLRDANLRLARSISAKKSSKGNCDGQKAKKGRKQQQKQQEPWKKEPPKEGEPLTKIVNNKTYNWCSHHQAWTFHTEADCRLKMQATIPRTLNQRVEMARKVERSRSG